MKPHPRIRKTIKWGGAVVTVLLVVVWVGSGWCGPKHLLLWSRTSLHKHYWISIMHGRLTAGRWDEQPFGIYLEVPFDLPHESWRLTLVPQYSWSKTGWNAAVPLWTFAACAAACTLCAWQIDRRARRHGKLNICPNCNYERTGLAAYAKCPECGAAAA